MGVPRPRKEKLQKCRGESHPEILTLHPRESIPEVPQLVFEATKFEVRRRVCKPRLQATFAALTGRLGKIISLLVPQTLRV